MGTLKDALRVARWARRRGPLSGFHPVARLRSTLDAARFVRDWRAYQRLPGAEPLDLAESWPCIHDRTDATHFDPQYFYQAVWASKLVAAHPSAYHVDVGSDHRFVGTLTSLTDVLFVDIRPLHVQVDGLHSVAGSILALPFADGALRSLSCLHVVEHIGLGRYGDPLNPEGTRVAVAELRRVLAPGGNLYFSSPIGRPRVQFNGQRVHAPEQYLAYFRDLELVRFSAVDRGRFFPCAEPAQFARSEYACGLYWFRKPAASAPG